LRRVNIRGNVGSGREIARDAGVRVVWSHVVISAFRCAYALMSGENNGIGSSARADFSSG
jgi:hypothetical protein